MLETDGPYQGPDKNAEVTPAYIPRLAEKLQAGAVKICLISPPGFIKIHWSLYMSANPRLMRTELLLGEDGIRRLQQACVMIVGLGAVGGYALEAVARSGVGRLILVDFDIFDETNINRQILALTSTVGCKKTAVAAERVREINPDCEIVVKDMFVDEDNLPELLDMKPDFVIDAIDSLNAKCCLIEELCRRGIPFVSSMGAALKTDPSCIKTARLNQTKNCGLSRLLRRRLKRRGVDLQSVRCVYSDEQAVLPGGGICPAEEKGTRNILGSLPTITAILA